MTDKERLLRLAISRVKGVGPRFFLKILEKFGSISEFLKNDNKMIFEDLKYRSKLIEEIRYKTTIKQGENIIKNISKYDINAIVFGQKFYPMFLKEIYDPPVVLYYKGNINTLSSNRIISVVGTRRMSNYGEKVTKDIVFNLVKNGFVIVSGLAFGVDKIAHIETIKNDGITIAVLAGNLLEATPRSNQNLFDDILANNGIIISENYLEDEIVAGSFPRRNRIIAGLSMATVVIEAGYQSGALITANLAFRENREVFAVPGNIDSYNSLGTNNLIKIEKAKLITDAEDILAVLGIKNNQKNDLSLILDDLDIKSKKIVNTLLINPLSEFELAIKTNLNSSTLFSLLTKLELKGIIERRENGKFYVNF